MGTGSIPWRGAAGAPGDANATSKPDGTKTLSRAVRSSAKPTLPPLRTGLFCSQPQGQAAASDVSGCVDRAASHAATRSVLAAKGSPLSASSSTGWHGATDTTA